MEEGNQINAKDLKDLGGTPNAPKKEVTRSHHQQLTPSCTLLPRSRHCFASKLAKGAPFEPTHQYHHMLWSNLKIQKWMIMEATEMYKLPEVSDSCSIPTGLSQCQSQDTQVAIALQRQVNCFLGLGWIRTPLSQIIWLITWRITYDLCMIQNKNWSAACHSLLKQINTHSACILLSHILSSLCIPSQSC